MLAAQIDTSKYRVTIYDKKKSVGRKFLVAGEGGLNLTFNSSFEELISNYSPSQFMQPFIHQFSNDDLIEWLNNIGVQTFVGSSNRVFPAEDFKPIEVLGKITEFIKSKGVNFQLDTKWTGWDEQGQLTFEDFECKNSDIIVFALGGASWKVTGSDGFWNENFKAKGICTIPFRAANCAFEVDWNKDFINKHEGKPLKNIAISFNDNFAKGELVISNFGLEGNAIYALSQKIQDELHSNEIAIIYLDLKPSLTVEKIVEKHNKSRHAKVTDILKLDINLDRTAIAILKHFTDKKTFSSPNSLAVAIKSLPVSLKSADDLDKAISSLGGIDINEIDENAQLKKMPNTYIIGEMLDWYAPTGGYLLQGCFSMGFSLANHLNELQETH